MHTPAQGSETLFHSLPSHRAALKRETGRATAMQVMLQVHFPRFACRLAHLALTRHCPLNPPGHAPGQGSPVRTASTDSCRVRHRVSVGLWQVGHRVVLIVSCVRDINPRNKLHCGRRSAPGVSLFRDKHRISARGGLWTQADPIAVPSHATSKTSMSRASVKSDAVAAPCIQTLL